MKKYIVSFKKTEYFNIEVEAENEKEAEDKADTKINEVKYFEWLSGDIASYDIEEQ